MAGNRKPSNQVHYDFFKSCMGENEFDHERWKSFKTKLEKRNETVDLGKADLTGIEITELDLSGVHLIGVDLSKSELFHANLSDAKLINVKLIEADLRNSILSNADLSNSYLSGIDFSDADLSNANLSRNKLSNKKNCFSRAILSGADFTGADFTNANLSGANISIANLSGSDLIGANLSKSYFKDTNLSKSDSRGADLSEAVLKFSNLSKSILYKADLTNAMLQSCNLSNVVFREVVFGNTKIINCTVNEGTDTRNSNLNNVNFSDGAKQTLEYINRRLNWKDWYRDHKFLRWIVEPFWWSSNYGRSITRVINVFLVFSFIFSLLYFFCPGVLEGLIPLDSSGSEIALPWWMRFTRSFYFSIVTMTTLGFGDINANPIYFFGHILLMIQVILGYGLLGALVTCLSVMFTSDGPAQQIEEEKNPWYKRLYRRIKSKLVKIYTKVPSIVKWGFSTIFFIVYMVVCIRLLS